MRHLTTLLIVITVAASGCRAAGESPPDDGELDCTPGDDLDVEDERYCIYEKPLLVETGFSVVNFATGPEQQFECPTLVPNLHAYGRFLVCAPVNELSDPFFDAMRAQYGDDVELADCSRVTCLAEQVCVGGACMSPGNDFDRASCETLAATDVATGAELDADGCYLVEEDLEVFGGTLVVGPGTSLYFARDTGLSVRDDGAIEAIGTVRRPVVFSGLEAERGYWRGIRLGSATNESHLIRTVVEFAGSAPWGDTTFADGRDQAAIVNADSRLTLRDSIVRQSGHFAVSSAGELGEWDGNLLTNNLRLASMSGRNWAFVGERNIFRFNTEELAAVAGSIQGDGTEQLRWNKLSAPYIVGDFTVEAAELVLDPGVEVRGDADGYVLIGNGASLTCGGTAQEPVLFTGHDSEPGAWRGVRIQSDGTNRGPSSVEFAEIEFGGAPWGDGLDANLSVLGAVNIDEVELRDSSSNGLAVDTEATTTFDCRTVVTEGNHDEDIVPASVDCSP